MLHVDSREVVAAVRAAIVEVLGDQEARDEEARGMARNALQAIQSHERLCMERSKAAETYRAGVQTSLVELRASSEGGIDRINRLLQRMLLSFTGTLVVMLGAILWQKFFS